MLFVFFFKQKTAYEMRISDWSSDVCSSDLLGGIPNPHIHLMYSDRVSDGIDRTPDRVFARFNPTHPAAGGCRKDSGGRTPIELRRQAKIGRASCRERVCQYV